MADHSTASEVSSKSAKPPATKFPTHSYDELLHLVDGTVVRRDDPRMAEKFAFLLYARAAAQDYASRIEAAYEKVIEMVHADKGVTGTLGIKRKRGEKTDKDGKDSKKADKDGEGASRRRSSGGSARGEKKARSEKSDKADADKPKKKREEPAKID